MATALTVGVVLTHAAAARALASALAPPLLSKTTAKRSDGGAATNNSLSKSYDAIQREGKKATFHIKTEAAMPMMPPVSSAV